METIVCTVCGTQNNPVLFEGQDEWFGLPGSFPVRHCQNCGLFYLNPRPTTAEIGRYYPPAYTPYLPAIEDEPSAWARFNRRLAMAKRLKLIQQHVPQPGRVLDVGCATGTLLAALRQEGWATNGVELSPHASAYARDRLKLDVFTGELAEAQFADHTFDLVIFWDVLEHLHQPRAALLEAARITQPGGRLLLSLPNPESVERAVFGRYWAGWDVPRHLNVFSKAVIGRLLQETGWQMTHFVCITGRYWLFNLSLEQWLKNKVKNPKVRQAVMRMVRSLPARVVSLPYFWLVEKLGKGSVMTIIAKRC